MSAPLGPKAMQMINEALKPVIKSGKRIDRIKLVVCPISPITQTAVVDTMYGLLLVVIRDIRKVEAIKHYLRIRNERDYVLFMIGINTGFRISDIRWLTVKDVKGTHIEIIEGKTKKIKKIKIRKTLRKALDDFIKGKQDYEYLFTGRSKKHTGNAGEPIDSSTAYKILSKAARANGVEEIGTYSMRKTFGYHFYL